MYNTVLYMSGKIKQVMREFEGGKINNKIKFLEILIVFGRVYVFSQIT